MSFLDTLGSSTIGILWRARTGTVDPWTLSNLEEEEVAARVKALGPAAAGNESEIQTQVRNQIESQLRSQNAHPDQAAPLIPDFLGIANGVLKQVFPIAVIALAGFAVYALYESGVLAKIGESARQVAKSARGK